MKYWIWLLLAMSLLPSASNADVYVANVSKCDKYDDRPRDFLDMLERNGYVVTIMSLSCPQCRGRVYAADDPSNKYHSILFEDGFTCRLYVKARNKLNGMD